MIKIFLIFLLFSTQVFSMFGREQQEVDFLGGCPFNPNIDESLDQLTKAIENLRPIDSPRCQEFNPARNRDLATRLSRSYGDAGDGFFGGGSGFGGGGDGDKSNTEKWQEAYDGFARDYMEMVKRLDHPDCFEEDSLSFLQETIFSTSSTLLGNLSESGFHLTGVLTSVVGNLFFRDTDVMDNQREIQNREDATRIKCAALEIQKLAGRCEDNQTNFEAYDTDLCIADYYLENDDEVKNFLNFFNRWNRSEIGEYTIDDLNSDYHSAVAGSVGDVGNVPKVLAEVDDKLRADVDDIKKQKRDLNQLIQATTDVDTKEKLLQKRGKLNRKLKQVDQLYKAFKKQNKTLTSLLAETSFMEDPQFENLSAEMQKKMKKKIKRSTENWKDLDEEEQEDIINEKIQQTYYDELGSTISALKDSVSIAADSIEKDQNNTVLEKIASIEWANRLRSNFDNIRYQTGQRTSPEATRRIQATHLSFWTAHADDMKNNIAQLKEKVTNSKTLGNKASCRFLTGDATEKRRKRLACEKAQAAGNSTEVRRIVKDAACADYQELVKSCTLLAPAFFYKSGNLTENVSIMGSIESSTSYDDNSHCGTLLDANLIPDPFGGECSGKTSQCIDEFNRHQCNINTNGQLGSIVNQAMNYDGDKIYNPCR